MCDSTDLSELSREELISIINQMKENENQMKEKIFLLETQLNQNKNKSKKYKSKKRPNSSGIEALDRQTVNKKLCLISSTQNSINRQSFSDRICDDLCEEIPQYLSLEDKLKLEGVSKQFQRTVLKKHYELTIKTCNSIRKRKVKNEYKYHFIENKFIEFISLEVLLKKCPNITSIELKRNWMDNCDFNPVFRLITKCCNNLREFKTCGNWINNKDIIKFQRKFGQKIKFFDRFHKPINFNLFPNIEKFVCDHHDYSGVKLVLPQLKLKQLTKLNMHIGEAEMVKTCVDTFPTLKHFDLQFRGQNSDSIYSSLDYISNLKNLIHFGFSNNYGNNNKLFCDSLKRMANKCQKLKSIECSFNINSDLKQLLSPFEAYPALKRLNLKLCGNFEIFSFEAFKGLSNITHLTLNFHSYSIESTRANILTDIDIHLPELQYFEMKNKIDATQEEFTQMADILSRLSRLQTLELMLKKTVNYEEFEVKIREKCREIRTINLKHSYY